jgi:hypothetical protein
MSSCQQSFKLLILLKLTLFSEGLPCRRVHPVYSLAYSVGQPQSKGSGLVSVECDWKEGFYGKVWGVLMWSLRPLQRMALCSRSFVLSRPTLLFLAVPRKVMLTKSFYVISTPIDGSIDSFLVIERSVKGSGASSSFPIHKRVPAKNPARSP